LFGGVDLKTKHLEIYERSRWVRDGDSDRYTLRMKIYGSLAELEKVRDAVFKLEEGS